ncbi:MULTISPECIES: 1-pyrroline-5-carboxylate dehydrogenase [Vibrio]|nr:MULTISPECIES: 1-pyrroline-5-carboxylate dehydrogenase [Vibrio]
MQTITRFSEVTVFDAQTAWQQWNLTEYSFKSECLLSVFNSLNKIDATLSNIMNLKIQHAQSYLAQPQIMPGPTGETNELYCAGRGVCALVVAPTTENVEQDSTDERLDERLKIAMSFMTAALIGGNSVVMCCDDESFNHNIQQAIGTTLPAHLVQIVAYDAHAKLINSEIAIAALVAKPDIQIKINRLLSRRDGAIVPLVTDDPDAVVSAFDPALVLRFITERTRTINITAVGGNATLLELGSGH